MQPVALLPVAGVVLGALPAETDALPATVLCEAATNVVRHSAARTCHVEAHVRDGRVRLRVANVGHRPPGEEGACGSVRSADGGRRELVRGRVLEREPRHLGGDPAPQVRRPSDGITRRPPFPPKDLRTSTPGSAL
ncbi:hypothetical protein [Nonomuraea sp. NPDC001699]